MKRALVTGAGGFIGHHLVKRLKADGYWVRGVDIKHPVFEETYADEFLSWDLRMVYHCIDAVDAGMEVYQLAADMGGIGYIGTQTASIALNNAKINLNMISAAGMKRAAKYLYTSSACVYRQDLQESPEVGALREQDAWPAQPEPGYGLEKLFSEEMCKYYHQDFGLDVRIVRFHNVYGPLGTWTGGREKAPAAICRKVAEAENGGTIEVWGDGQQTRSFMYIDDCIEGVRKIMESGYKEPLNLGRSELVTVDDMVKMVADIAGKHLSIVHDTSKPQGVRGRNSDNTKIKAVLNWEPGIDLRIGLGRTYGWIAKQVTAKKGQPYAEQHS